MCLVFSFRSVFFPKFYQGEDSFIERWKRSYSTVVSSELVSDGLDSFVIERGFDLDIRSILVDLRCWFSFQLDHSRETAIHLHGTALVLIRLQWFVTIFPRKVNPLLDSSLQVEWRSSLNATLYLKISPFIVRCYLEHFSSIFNPSNLDSCWFDRRWEIWNCDFICKIRRRTVSLCLGCLDEWDV